MFGRDDWWDAPELGLHHTAQRIASDAKREVQRWRGGITSGRMVAELPFGFWVSLLGSGTDYETRLWRPGLRRAFPGYRGRRAALHRDYAGWVRAHDRVPAVLAARRDIGSGALAAGFWRSRRRARSWVAADRQNGIEAGDAHITARADQA
jgi:hypothetical protein